MKLTFSQYCRFKASQHRIHINPIDHWDWILKIPGIHLILMNKSIKRPVYLNLFQIRMPVMAIVSILHRLSGVLWIAALPFLLYGLEMSLRDQQGFQQVMAWLKQPLAAAIGLLWLWFLLHHFFAGIRFLLLDIEIGVRKQWARRSAWLVHVASILSLLLIIGWFK